MITIYYWILLSYCAESCIVGIGILDISKCDDEDDEDLTTVTADKGDNSSCCHSNEELSSLHINTEVSEIQSGLVNP